MKIIIFVDSNLMRCAPSAILGWYLDAAEAVDCDAEDGVDGGEADGVVEREPEITNVLAQQPPLARQQIDSIEGHGQ